MTFDLEQYAIQDKILKAAGIRGGSYRKAFIRDNPEAVKLYSETYRLTDDKEMKEQFTSKNPKIAAAMLLATQKLVDNHNWFIRSSDMGRQTAIDTKLKQYFDESLAEIETGYIEQIAAEDVAKTGTNARIQQEKVDNETIIEKNARAEGKVKTHEITVACKTKKCELTTFRIDSAGKRDSEADVKVLGLFAGSRSSIDNLINEDMGTVESVNLVDIFNSTKGLEEIHLIGGKLNFFQQNIKIVAKGTCDHGNAGTTCPQVRIRSEGNTIDKTGSRSLWLENTDEQLLNTRLMPHVDSSIQPEISFKGFMTLLKDQSGHSQATYDFEAKSCQNIDYKGYYARLVVHRPNVIKFGLKWKLPLYGDKSGTRKHTINAEIYSRMDEEEFKHDLSLNNNIKDILKNIIPGPPWISTLLTSLQFTLNRLSSLGNEEDECAALDITPDNIPEEFPEYEKEDDGDDCSDDDTGFSGAEEIPEDKPASILPIELHLAYRRILKPLPNANYEEVGYYQEIYLAASPLLQYKKSVNVLNAIWKSSLRASLATVTLGASEVAAAASKWGIFEGIEGSFNDYYHALKQAAKSWKLSQMPDGETKDKIVSITDEEVSVYLGSKNTGIGAKAKCLLEMSVAVESDNPGAGFVISKEAGADKFTIDKGKTSFYSGINFQVTGEIAGNLRLMKMIGCQPTDMAAGIKVEVISADNTAPVRLAVNFCLDKEFVKNAESEAKNKQAISDSAEKIKEKAIVKARTTKYSGLGKEYNEAKKEMKMAEKFAEQAKKAAENAKEAIEYAKIQEAKAAEEPLGLNTSFLFSGVAIYFSAYIEVTKFSNESLNANVGFGNASSEVDLGTKPEVISTTTKTSKISIGIMKDKNIMPSWQPLPFKDIFNKSYV